MAFSSSRYLRGQQSRQSLSKSNSQAMFESEGRNTSSESSESDTNTPSVPLLYTLIPTLLRRRIPKQLRQALASSSPSSSSDYNSSSPTARTRRHTRIASVESITPPPSYRSNIDENESDATRSSGTFASASGSRPSTSGSGSMPAAATAATYAPNAEEQNGSKEPQSEINWIYARPGIALLSLAAQESSGNRTSFARRQYIDGVACVLRSLPEELTAEEEICLREAMMIPRFTNSNSEGNKKKKDGRLLPFQPRRNPRTDQHPPSPTLLHSITASLTLSLILLFSFLTPYFRALLQHLYALDRKHQLKEKVLASGLAIADGVGKQGMVVAKSVWGWNEGRVGVVLGDVGEYCVRGVGGGVCEGLGEGWRVLGLRGGYDGEGRGGSGRWEGGDWEAMGRR